jgi:hypothetical protein
MNQRLIEALENSIKLMDSGVPLEDCINDYPDLENELRELLWMAEGVKSLRIENIPAELMNRSRIKLLSRSKYLESNSAQEIPSSIINRLANPFRISWHGLHSLSPLAGRLFLVLGITGLLILFSGGLLITSAKSLPGDSLYPVKRAVEDIRVYLAPGSEVRNEYEADYSQQRVDEVKQLIGLDREQQVSFEGKVEALSDSRLIVDGIPVSVLSNTTIVGGSAGIKSIELGMKVEVEGRTTNGGNVIANEVHIREYQFIGRVEIIDANYWQISGIQVQIKPVTQIDSGIQVGDEITILIRSEDNGLYALAILRDVHLLETPNSIPAPTTTPTPDESSAPIDEEMHQFIGNLDKISENYWVINGQVIYIVGGSHISDGIKLGDSVTVDYMVELNGSFTAIEIQRNDNYENTEEYKLQATPEVEGDGESHKTQIMTTEDNEKGDPAQTPEGHDSPEPSENYSETP